MRTLRVVLLPEADDAEHEDSDGFLEILFVRDNKIHGSCQLPWISGERPRSCMDDASFSLEKNEN